MMNKMRMAVLISGRGSNLQALIRASQKPHFPGEIICVISDKEQAPGLAFAQSAAIPTIIAPKDLHQTLIDHKIDLICLAGYMKILPQSFVDKWPHKIINIHPSLLPSFKGLHPQKQALENGNMWSGASVHIVTNELDSGPLLYQTPVPIFAHDTEATLADRILTYEHDIYARAIEVYYQKYFNNTAPHPQIGIIMGSKSDWPVMQQATKQLEDFNIPYEAEIVSAHRTPHKLYHYASAAHHRGLKLIIAGAGGAAHLPGMVAALTPLPVIGVPVMSQSLNGVDSLLSIVQMPKGVPVASVAINNAMNAALLAIRILSLGDPSLAQKLQAFIQDQTNTVINQDLLAP